MKVIEKLIKLFIKKRTPQVIQMEAVECGAAALSMILGYYGKFVSLEELRVICGVSRDGVTAYNIIQAAKHYGLEADGYEMTAQELQETQKPAILFWDYNHFVVLEKFWRNKVYINDPATGPRWIHKEELEKSYSGLVIQAQPTEKFEKGGKSNQILPRLFERIQGFKNALIYLFFVQFSLIMIGLAAPVFSQLFIDEFLLADIPSWKIEFFLMVIGVMILTGAITWIREFFLNALQIKLSIRYSTEFLWHLLRLPTVFFSQRSGGEVVNRLDLNNQISTIFTGEVVINLISMLLVSIYGLIMFQYSFLITCISILATFVNLLLLWYINRTRIHAYARQQQEDAKTIGISLDTIEHIESIKACAEEPHFFTRIAGYYTKSVNAAQEMGRKGAYLITFSNLTQELSTIFLITIGCWEILHGRMSIGMLIAFQILLAAFLRPFNQLVNFASDLQTVKVDLARVDDVLQNSQDPVVKERKVDLNEVDSLSGKIEFQNITFGYHPLDEPLVKDFNLTIEPGEMIAFVGPVGSGKTTLSKIASSLYLPWKGKVLYDGKEYNQISRNTFSKSLATIDQQIYLFEGSVKENITLWDENIPEEWVSQAAQNACIENEILKFPEGFQAQLIEDGANLSQGQRQRIEIARSFVLNPSILIMDEATNYIDAETEEKIMQNIRNKKCTCLVISHRLSTIKNADKILVLENGKVVQSGTHEKLKKAQGPYQKLLEYEIKK